MTIRVALHHTTCYQYDRLVKLTPHIVRLRPAPHSRTPVLSYSLNVQPDNHFINWQQDPFGNYQARLVFPERTRLLTFEVEVIADLIVFNPFDFFVEDYASVYPFRYHRQLAKELVPYLEKEPGGSLFAGWLGSVAHQKMAIIDFLVTLNQRLAEDIEYCLRFEPGVQTPEQTLALSRGSCRDSAWLLVQLLRHLGLAARFVSGYLVQLTSDTPSLDGPSGPKEDFTDLHAWCEVYLPGAGWIGLDPTSGLLASEGHIPLACTPDPVSAAPISGASDKCEVTFDYANEVTRIHEDPRVTRPYSEAQWQHINGLGEAVDRELKKGDVRLTMGGEPTFVSIDDMDSAQWNTEALGDDKRRLAEALLLRLHRRFAPAGLLYYGLGKWYPGEDLPRWALGCFWRTDGLPLWQDPIWLAALERDYGYGLSEASKLIDALAERLAVSPAFILPAYEDALYYRWQERRLPAGVDPHQAGEEEGVERLRLARVLNQGLDNASGYALPLGWDRVASHWYSTDWPLKTERLVLVPGDSPLGLRLPLDSLPAADEALTEPARDPFTPRRPLHEPGEAAALAVRADKPVSARHKVLRTTLCVEPRDGKLHVFMPPIEDLEQFILLLNCVEQAAECLGYPVVIEGYEPPRDSRLQKLLVTPDPGVIEVNIHPASNWRELVDNTTILYEEARLARLGTEKFMLDGRHTGTGGGNHVTLGGATPADSPLLRRPDLLRSLITYWQHHPGLSYLFSGMFIGPTSQAPRVDEGRDETLYELEIAFQQMPEGLVEQPWLVDRLMRNLLVDITGNTHRAEFCIDKLYSPDTPAGRQGILEFRGFEMPPHAQMSLVQILLLRCLVARFWHTPYHKPLVRWGTTLHDRFMLPHYVWQDLRDVIQDLNDHGYPFQLDWLRPFEEFRFPHYGRLDLGDLHLELRWAIEPWHVLGEEVSSFGTARYVDSSVERLQVRGEGFSGDRYIVTCNGRRVPMTPTARQGEFVAGVRYRAWQPPSALHPTIGVQAPLVFDVVDTWNGRALGGCTYHVAHAGGRNYETLPVNAFEAESRRVSRFWDQGHTPGALLPHTGPPCDRQFTVNQPSSGPLAPAVEELLNEYPHTLDLRRR